MQSASVLRMRQVKAKLATGKLVTAISLNHSAPSLVDQIAGFGFDIVLVDCEKYNFTTERIDDIARASRAAGMATVVRPWLNEAGLISRCLDLGADGIMMAACDTVEAAQRLVTAVHYARYDDYQDKLIIAMIESVEGIDRLPDLLAVPGVDVWSIGANDVAQRMGMAGKTEDQLVQAQVERAIAEIVGAGRSCGILGTYGNAADRIAQGVRYLSTSVNGMLARGAEEYQRMVRDFV